MLHLKKVRQEQAEDDKIKLPHKILSERTVLAMNIISQKNKYHLFLIKYTKNHGATKAAIKYNMNIQYTYS